MRLFRQQRGDTLVEVVFAIAILASVMTAAYRMSTLSFQLGVDSREHTQAISFAQQQLESLRWWADQRMGSGTALVVAGAPNLGACTYNVACYMPTGAGAAPTAGIADCSASVATGCQAKLTLIDDIALNTAVAGATTPAKFPEIDEQVTVTWPSTNGKDTCINGITGCNKISFNLRIADTTAYAPLDCNVAGSPGCSTAATGVGSGCTPGAQMHINPPPGDLTEPSGITTTISFTIQNTAPGTDYLVGEPEGGGAKIVTTFTGTGCGVTVTWDYPGSGIYDVQACTVPSRSPTLKCSDNTIKVSPGIPNATNCNNGNPTVDPNDGISYVCGLLGNYFDGWNWFTSSLVAKRWQHPTVWFPDIIKANINHSLKNVLCGGSEACDVTNRSILWTGQIKLTPGVNQICVDVDDGAAALIGGGTVGGYGGPLKNLFSNYSAASIPTVECGTYDNTLGFTWWFPLAVYYNNTCCSVTNGGYFGNMLMSFNGLPVSRGDNMSGLLRVQASQVQNPDGTMMP